MPEIIKTYAQIMPPSRFIGKCYFDEDRDASGGFGEKWNEWFADNLLEKLEKLLPTDPKDFFEDGDAYIGLMRWKEGEPFQYWIGMFVPAGTAVPEGFECLDFPQSRIGVCWLKGKMDTIFGQEDKSATRLTEEGYTFAEDAQGASWFFERYGCPRFTTPDADGNVILDIVHYIAD